jgi:hypothetical protein
MDSNTGKAGDPTYTPSANPAKSTFSTNSTKSAAPTMDPTPITNSTFPARITSAADCGSKGMKFN